MRLFRRLRHDGIYVPEAGWAVFGLRLLAGNAALFAVVWLASPPLARWMEAGWQTRGLWTAGIVALSMVAYFAALWLTGLRVRHFRRA